MTSVPNSKFVVNILRARRRENRYALGARSERQADDRAVDRCQTSDTPAQTSQRMLRGRVLSTVS